jgi:hypothetical protein
MEAFMRNISMARFIANTVLIKFSDGPVFFRVPRGATLADISENLDSIGKWHKGPPISVDVSFKASEQEDGYSRARRVPLISSPVSRPEGRRTVSRASRTKLASGDGLDRSSAQ